MRELKESEWMAVISERAAMVGYDLYNPLRAIVCNVSIATEKLKSLPSKEMEISVHGRRLCVQGSIEKYFSLIC